MTRHAAAPRNLRAGFRSRGSQLRGGNDPFNLQIDPPFAQRVQSRLVPAELDELRSTVRLTRGRFACVVPVAHRVQGSVVLIIVNA